MKTLRLANDRLTVDVAPFGARLHAIHFDGSPNLVVSAKDEADATSAARYHGATVGPVANRIGGATAEIDGHAYNFDTNERDTTTLHGGHEGTHAQTWTVAEHKEETTTLKLDLPDGAGGFPGNRHLTASFAVDANRLDVRYTATTDAATWINLALHPYWALGAPRENLHLFVAADAYTAVGHAQIPTGEIAPVKDSLFDLNTLAAPSAEIDHNYVLTAADPAVTLCSETLCLDITTDAPGVQIFTGQPFGIAIEPQGFPDAMHHPNFPSIELRAGETYAQHSSYRFSAR